MNTNRFIYIVFMLLLCANGFTQKTIGYNCLNSLNELVKIDSVKKDKLQEYLRLQSKLTLHKLSWALLKDEKREGFKVEKKILGLLEQIKDKNESNEEFKKVYELFKDPMQAVSRNALSLVLPFVSDILNKQAEEEKSGKRKDFHLNISDVKTLSILAEKEEADKYGRYKHLFYKNRKTDNSILNFTKIINSSIYNTPTNNKSIRNGIKKELEKVLKLSENLLKDLKTGLDCNSNIEPQSKSCVLNDKASINKKLVDEYNLLSILAATQKLDGFDSHKYLRYGDVWLHTGKSSLKERKRRAYPAKIIKKTELSDEEKVHNYLIDHVLAHMPHYLTRENLKKDKSLTLALAQAIDSGALAKKGDERRFYYRGEAYFIPELWNTSQKGSNRGVQMLYQAKDDVVNFLIADDYKTPKNNGVKASDEAEFETTWMRMKENRGQEKAFFFKGKSYSIITGQALDGKLDTLLLHFKAPEKYNKARFPFDSDKIKEMSLEISRGNRSYFSKDGTAKHISGVPVDLERETKRMKGYFNKGNFTVSGVVKKEIFPSESSIKQFIDEDQKAEQIVKKAFADRKVATRINNKPTNLLTLSKIEPIVAAKIVSDHKESFGKKNRFGSVALLDKEFVAQNALAVLNKRKVFNYKDEDYSTRTSKKKQYLKKLPVGNASFIASSTVKERRDQINTDTNELNKLIQFHKGYVQKCDEYTVVDKENAFISVYKNNGEVLFKKEILLGSKKGDKRTRYINSKTRETNSETGAGIYHIGDKIKFRDNFKGNVLDLNTQNQNSRLSLSQVAISTPERLTSFGDHDISNNRLTNGGIMLQEKDMKTYLSQFAKKDCPFYVLPETNQAKFLVRDNQLTFSTNCKNCSNLYNTRKAEIKTKPIIARIIDPRYKNKLTSEFVQTLVREKKDLMPLLGISNDEYNALLKISFGVLGAESEFGENFYYKAKETKEGQKAVSALKGDKLALFFLAHKVSTPILSPLIGMVEDSVTPNKNNNSRGLTQVKNISNYLKGKYKQSINMKNLGDPKNASIATMFILANKLKSLKSIESKHSAINEGNRLDYLYYLYMGASAEISGSNGTPLLSQKVSKVNRFARGIQIDEKI